MVWELNTERIYLNKKRGLIIVISPKQNDKLNVYIFIIYFFSPMQAIYIKIKGSSSSLPFSLKFLLLNKLK